jgi:hypothetical protein
LPLQSIFSFSLRRLFTLDSCFSPSVYD